MHLSLFETSDAKEVIALFTRVFSASEGEKEGKSIGNLVANLITKTKPSDLIGCVAIDNGTIVGCIFFSRLLVPSNQVAFILSPVAVDTPVQGTGIGQRLISYGIDYLGSRNVDLVFTYGDPAFYSKTGFGQITENIVKAPFPLSQPAGWLAQSLNGDSVQVMSGSSRCVEALSDPGYW
ncbi:MAG: N-acetyltransferase [Halioglobus sp.]